MAESLESRLLALPDISLPNDPKIRKVLRKVLRESEDVWSLHNPGELSFVKRRAFFAKLFLRILFRDGRLSVGELYRRSTRQMLELFGDGIFLMMAYNVAEDIRSVCQGDLSRADRLFEREERALFGP